MRITPAQDADFARRLHRERRKLARRASADCQSSKGESPPAAAQFAHEARLEAEACPMSFPVSEAGGYRHTPPQQIPVIDRIPEACREFFLHPDHQRALLLMEQLHLIDGGLLGAEELAILSAMTVGEVRRTLEMMLGFRLVERHQAGSLPLYRLHSSLHLASPGPAGNGTNGTFPSISSQTTPSTASLTGPGTGRG